MTVSWDVAFTIPMLEMCASNSSAGLSHCVFVDEVLYIYRIDTPINDSKLKRPLQLEVEKYIRTQLTPYKPLDTLFAQLERVSFAQTEKISKKKRKKNKAPRCHKRRLHLCDYSQGRMYS